MKIPSIKVDAKVSESPFQNGTFQVPLYDVGHHQGTPNPGSIGNSIFVGHVDTINYGRVFESLADVKVGDAIYIYTDKFRTDWEVSQVKAYPVGNISFLLQTSDARVTLYTCHGTWDWDRRDYNERLAVVAKFVGYTKTDRSAP
jgi:LPXTG-site transpeptidase (sortase) family protein